VQCDDGCCWHVPDGLEDGIHEARVAEVPQACLAVCQQATGCAAEVGDTAAPLQELWQEAAAEGR